MPAWVWQSSLSRCVVLPKCSSNFSRPMSASCQRLPFRKIGTRKLGFMIPTHGLQLFGIDVHVFRLQQQTSLLRLHSHCRALAGLGAYVICCFLAFSICLSLCFCPFLFVSFLPLFLFLSLSLLLPATHLALALAWVNGFPWAWVTRYRFLKKLVLRLVLVGVAMGFLYFFVGPAPD